MMKRAAAWILVILMIFQILPVEAENDPSGWYQVVSDELESPVFHAVHFTAEGEEVSTVYVADGAQIDHVPDAPSFSGKRFIGWYIQNTALDTNMTVSGDVDITAVYTTVDQSLEYKKEHADFLFEDTGAYAQISIFGYCKKNQKPSAKKDNSVTGATVLEAWTASNIKNNTDLTVEAVIIAVPTEGELSGYTVLNGAVDKRVGANLVPGDRISFDLSMKGAKGIALVTGRADYEDDQLVENGAIYANEDLYITGKIPGKGIVEATPVKITIDGTEATVAYDIKIYANENQRRKGKTWKPAGDKVQVHLRQDAFDSGLFDVYHLKDVDAEPEFIDTVQAKEDWIEFDAEDFSVYAVKETILNKTVTTSDGSTYDIQVTYQNTAGIPMTGTELLVSEILEGDEQYDTFIEKTLEKIDAAPENVEFARVFDIRITDEKDHSIIYEPLDEVDVSIRLLGTRMDECNEIDVLHFVRRRSDYAVFDMENTASGETVQFSTDSFSVYVVIGTVPLRTYWFYTFDEYGDYTEYALNTDTESVTFTQTIKNGENVIVPSNPTNPQDPTATFAGWYQDITPVGETEQVLADEPYDFNHIPEITVDENVKLYAKFRSYAYVIFHDQYDADSESFPIAYTERVEVVSGQSTEVDISGRSVVYGGGTSLVFYGWSRTEITNPGAELDDYYHNIIKEEDIIAITETTHLYPIFKKASWLSFYSGPTGSGANYYPETFYFDGVGPNSLTEYIPTRDGNYAFNGWYAGATLDSNGETIAEDPAVKIANADGTLVSGASASGITVDADGIKLSGNVTLYAGWTQIEMANYTIVILRQKASDEVGTSDPNKTYEFAESFLLSGVVGSSISLGSDDTMLYTTLNTDTSYNNLHTGASVSGTDNPYYGYVYNQANSTASTTILANGSAVLYVSYDWTDKPNMDGRSFVLTFADSVEAGSPDLPVVYDQESGDDAKIPYDAVLENYVPASPTSGRQGYSFTGWFIDQACTTRVFFHNPGAEELEQLEITEDGAVTGHQPYIVISAMPGVDITFYAGWEKEWYIVTIDPNYGALYAYNGSVLEGSGATWFWSAYGDKIQEYTTVTRDYVESDTGTWYYVNHNKQGSDAGLWPDDERKTYYTTNPSEATEFTTFAYEPGIYRYEGWYEVKKDGTEVRYDFNRIVEGNITLKLHWTKVGAFYLQYVAGEGSLNNEEELETLYVELDGGVYADNADVVVNRTATPPEGYEFVGWSIRGDDSGTVYRPGESFTLLTRYAATVQGRRTVYLEAIYTRVPMATIVYHANGGTMDPATVDYGSVPEGNPVPITSYDVSAGTVTVSNLVNNSRIFLSDGSVWLSMENAEFAGWSSKQNYDPHDPDDHLFLPATATDEVYNVDIEESYDLYAVWKVRVNYHLNNSEASFSDDWGEDYTLNGDAYTQEVYLQNATENPNGTVSYSGSDNQIFRYWATRSGEDEPYVYTRYDFSEPVRGELDLYAYWEAPLSVTIHAVDSSADTIMLTDSESGWTVPSSLAITEHLGSLTTIAPDYITAPSGYVYAFTTVHSGDLQALEEKPVEELYYSTADGKVHVAYSDGRDAALADGEEIYFVYYQTKQMLVSYMTMAIDTKLTAVESLNNNAPIITEDLGEYHMADAVTAPLAWANFTDRNYAFGIGSADADYAHDLMLISAVANSDATRPSFQVQNTWRGFLCSTDGNTWISCGYSPVLYVLYYDRQPTLVTFTEETFGFNEDMEYGFAFHYTIEDTDDSGSTWKLIYDSESENAPVILRNGEAYSAILFTDATSTQRVTVTKRAETNFTTMVNYTEGDTDTYTADDTNVFAYTYTADETGIDQEVTFTHTRKPAEIEVHAAQVDAENGRISLQDGWRATEHTFSLSLDDNTVFNTKLPGAGFITDQPDYAFGAVFYGTDDGNAITAAGSMNIVSIGFEPVEEGSHVYDLFLLDGNGNRLTTLDDYRIYYLYYPKLTVYYLLEKDSGVLEPITGFLDENITYGGQSLSMNGMTITQGQKVEMPPDGLTISQTVANGHFNMPPLLDDGTNEYALVYSKIAALAQADNSLAIQNTSSLNGFISEGLTLYLKIVNNRLSWSFDNANWTQISNWPVVYAIYRERGYPLTINKTVPIDTGYEEPFTVTVESTAINRTNYDVEGTGTSTIDATPASDDTPGSITFTVTDGSSVKLIGLGAGEYTITETDNENFILSTRVNNTDQSIADNHITIQLLADTTVEMTNTAEYICQVGNRKFHTITSAVEWIEANSADFSGTIEMLVDYMMPSSDAPVIPDYMNVTLTSAEGTRKITRKNSFTNGAMFLNSGSFTLQNLTLDGNHVSTSGTMIENEGTLMIGSGATLTGAASSRNGSVIKSWGGSLTVAEGAAITDSSASTGGVIYASGGTIVISGGTISGNNSSNGGAIYYSGSESVTISGGSLSGNTSSSNGGAIYMSTGVLTVTGGSITNNTAAANGGAVYAVNAAINISGGTIGGEDKGNSAANGGAVYVENGSVTVSGNSTSISYNSATGSGGAIYAHTATVSMSGGTVSHNTAANGGAIYANTGNVTITKGTLDSNAAGQNGGGIYAASGTISLSNNTTVLSNNTAVENGGAVYAGSGQVSANKAKFTGNGADNNGGSLWTGTGQATLTECTMTGNHAVNGAAVFADSATVTFNKGNVTGNTASFGGAVGIGSTTARLNFQNNITVTGNMMGSGADAVSSNVYLDQDSDAVINAIGLGGSATVGIYVAGELTGDLFMNRGVPSAVFGTYTNTSYVDKFRNDRLPDLSVQMNTAAKKLYWGKAFTVVVRYLQSYTSPSGLPPTATGTTKYTDTNYNPPSGLNAASEIASSLQDKVNATAVFAHAFLDDATSFGDYVTDVNWDSERKAWTFIKRDGNIVTGTKLILYFSEPAYISIENNTAYELIVNSMNVLNLSVINSESDAGYGYVFAENGAIQDTLYPITEADLTLQAGKSIKMLFPGGMNAVYSLSGSFEGATADISYTLTGGPNPYTLTSGSAGSFTLPLSGQPGTTLSTSGDTYEIIFGGSKAICKIVTGTVDGVSDNEIAGKTDTPDENGNIEYKFSTLNQAKDFITNHMNDTKAATIEMLVDYLIPGTDVVTLPAGYDITFTTATTGVYQYPGPGSRATISRDQGNNFSFITTETGTLTNGQYNSKLTVKNLIFDGKNFGGNSIEGGVIKTKGWNVEIEHTDFRNCQARYGGGVFIESVWPSKPGKSPYGYLTVSNSSFTNCKSLEGTDKFGGGGIWTSMREMTVTGCNFNSCEGAATIGNQQNAQGGAVFHYVGDIDASIATKSTVTNCTFDNCSANAAGSMECGSREVRVTGCIFRNSTAKTKNGGALNVWVYDNANPTKESHVYVVGCTFENCYCLSSSNGNGGALRSTATHNEFIDCTFKNTTGVQGGAIAISNSNAVKATFTNCQMENCTASNQGGAIYCTAKEFIANGSNNIIQNCTATNEGGGIYHGRSGSSMSISGMTIDNCKSKAKAGGGVYSNAQNVTLNQLTVSGCTTPQQGGGLYLAPANNAASLCSITDSTISGNMATGDGGGLYHSRSGKTLTITGSTIASNVSGGMGGGVYTNAGPVTINGTTVMDNTATGNGGGICHNLDQSNTLTLNSGSQVTGNKSGGIGGGVYTLANLALNAVSVTGNSLSHNTADSAAGVYMKDGRTLNIGDNNQTEDTIYIRNNTTDEGAPSDLRLPMNGSVNSNSVRVLCNLKGEIRVVNAFVKGTQFGSSNIEYVGGFSDLDHVFIADDDSLYGVIDRSDSTHKKIIWGTEPICKITDDKGRLLYMSMNGTSYPAVFDYLDRNNGSGTNDISAFGILRGHSAETPKLYDANGNPYTGTTYQVKMLVENYTADSAVITPQGTGKTVILTTAGKSDSLYPYRGRTGTRSTIHRSTNVTAMITVKSNLTMQNIVLDSGSEAGAPYGQTSRILLAETADTTIRLGKNATLQNAKLSSGNTAYGAGVLLNNGAAMIIEGGSIRNCSTEKSGGGVQVQNGSLTIKAGSITQCSAVGQGGGVNFENGELTMSGGSITRCNAVIGAGVSVANGKAMTMSGGSISGNTATGIGGGIAVGGDGSRLYFSGASYVYGNTLNGDACNVQMDQHFEYGALTDSHASDTTVIVSRGLIRGATIGVYVPDGPELYNQHGDIQMPFGTYVPGTNSETLNYFINDRNSLKGGLYETQAADNYMIYWVKIYSLKVSKLVMSDDPRDSVKEFRFTVELSGEASHTLAQDFNGTYGDMTFTNGRTSFKLKSGESITAEKLPFGYGYTVEEELTEAEQQYYNTTPGRSQHGEMNVETRYLYEVNFNNIHAICKITDTHEGLLYYRRNDGTYAPAIYSKLTSAFNALVSTPFYYHTGDSFQPATTVNTDRTKVEMLVDYDMGSDDAPAFQANTKATLTTADRNASDGYPYIGSGSTATIRRGFNGKSMITVNGDLKLENITLDGNSDRYSANTNGGILNVSSSGNLTVGSGANVQNSTTQNKNGGAIYNEGTLTVSAGSISGNTTGGSGSGGAIYNGGTMNLTDGSITDSTAAYGAGIYLATGSTMNISGAPTFNNNVSTGVTPASGSTNGGDPYLQALQDIYIQGYANADATSMTVTGNITSGPGSIWVWAETQRHYEQSKQFAVMSGGTYTGLNAFRNAWPDSDTKNPLKTDPKYLFGISRGNDGKVYWSGSMDLAVIKTVDGNIGNPADQFEFTVSGLDKGTQYNYIRYTSTDGDEWDIVPGQKGMGTLIANDEGIITFILSHHQKIVISIPSGTTVTITEANGQYKARYSIDGATDVSDTGTSITTTEITMYHDITVAFRNTLNAVSPTGVNFRIMPYALLLSMGIVLLLPVMLAGRRRRKNRD